MINSDDFSSWKKPAISKQSGVIKEKYPPPIEDFYFLKFGNIWRYMKGQHFSFWMVCFYLFFEYARPQSIFRELDVMPWAQFFLIGSLIGAILDKSVVWVSSSINKWLVMFGIAILLSIMFAEYPEISQRLYMNFYSWFIIYFLIICIVNTKQRLYVFMLVFILCSAKIAIGTAKVWVMRGGTFTQWGLMGPPGYFQNSGELAILMLTLFPIAYLLFFVMKNRVSRFEKAVMLVFWVSPILTVLGSSTRGSQVALLFILILIFRRKLFQFKPLILIIALSFISYSLLPEEQKLRFENIGDDRSSTQRLLYLEHGIDMIMEHPIFGVGFFNFVPYFTQHFPDSILYERAQLPHNIFIQVGTDAGFFGLIPFAVMLITPLVWLRRYSKLTGCHDYLYAVFRGVVLGIIGFVIAGQFVTVTYYPFLWIGLAFLVSTKNIIDLDVKKERKMVRFTSTT